MRKLSWIKRTAVLGVVASAAALAGVSPAGAASTAEHATALPARTTLQNLATGFVLDSNHGGDVYAIGRNGGAYQSWIVTPSDYGSVTLRNVATNRCLDSNTDRDVYTLGCNGGMFQKWQVVPSSYGTVVLENMATRMVLDSNANHDVYTMPANGGSYQKWTPAPA